MLILSFRDMHELQYYFTQLQALPNKAHITEADQLAQIYSNLYQSIQDVFAEADVEIMSPHYMAVRDGNETTIPKSGLKPEETKEGENREHIVSHSESWQPTVYGLYQGMLGAM